MPPLFTLVDFATLLDGLAIVCSLVMILFLRSNRRRYGRLVMDKKGGLDQAGFAGQLTLQMMAQQSQKAYANLQQSLAREFESLRSMETSILTDPSAADLNRTATTASGPRHDRRWRYRMAREKMARGDAHHQIAQQCGLSEGELELLLGLQRLEEGEAAETKHPMGVTS